MTPKLRVVTASSLLEQLRPFGPAIDGYDLVFDRDAPDDLWPFVRVLQTGIRAILSGRRWYSNDANGRGTGPGEYGELDPGLPIPAKTVRMIVESDPGWDRILPSWRETCAGCFAAVATTNTTKKGTGHEKTDAIVFDPMAGDAQAA